MGGRGWIGGKKSKLLVGRKKKWKIFDFLLIFQFLQYSNYSISSVRQHLAERRCKEMSSEDLDRMQDRLNEFIVEKFDDDDDSNRRAAADWRRSKKNLNC